MLDESASNGILVWGIFVPISANGRRAWPDEIKAMAAERVGAGSEIVDVAREIGANESLVAKWVRGAPSKISTQGFVELTRPREARKPQFATAPGQSDLRIRLGDTEISVPPGYPPAHLAEVIKAVRDAP